MPPTKVQPKVPVEAPREEPTENVIFTSGNVGKALPKRRK